MGQAVSGSKGPSLRLRIAGGVLAGLVVLFSFFGFFAIRTINLSVDVALEERLHLAQISAASVDDLVEHTARQLERAATFVGIGPTEDEEGRAEVVHELLSEFSQVVRLNPEGGVLWIVPPRTDDVGWAFADDEAVRAAVRRTETSVVVPARGNLADDLIAILVTPLDRRDRSAGFLAGELRASHADVNLLSLPRGVGSVHAEIVDAAGYIVFESGGGEPSRLDEHVEVLPPLIASGRSGTTIHRPESGADHVVAYYPFRSRPGGLVIEQTEDAALAIPLEMQRTMLVYGIGALLIASVAAWLHAHSVVRPIRRLTGDAARMASGDLDNPITVSRDDEIGELAMRFDEMRVKLKASREASAHWTEELEDRVRERTREVVHKNLELNVLSQTRRQLLAKTISAQEDERKRLARELHDDSAQTLTAVLMTLKTAEDALPAGPNDARSALSRSRSQLEGALREIRKAIMDLRPSALDDLGLAAAVRWYADEHLRPHGIKVDFEIRGEEEGATGAVATAVFRIAQEAITNIIRHSRARRARISLEFGQSAVVTVIEDDGDGFAPDDLRQPGQTGAALVCWGCANEPSSSVVTSRSSPAPGRGHPSVSGSPTRKRARRGEDQGPDRR